MSDPQQARSVRSRQSLLDAGRELIGEVGIDELTLAEVARRAGLAVGTVYNRFTDKQHLIEEIVREWTGEVTAAFSLRRITSEAADDGRASLSALVGLFREHRRFIRQIVMHSPLDPHIAAIVEPWLEEERAKLVGDLGRVTGSSERGAQLAALMTLATIERAAVRLLSDEEWSRLEADLPAAGLEILMMDRPHRPALEATEA